MGSHLGDIIKLVEVGDGLHIHDVFAMAIGKLPSEQIMVEQVGKLPSGQIMEQDKLDEGGNQQTIESLEERKRKAIEAEKNPSVGREITRTKLEKEEKTGNKYDGVPSRVSTEHLYLKNESLHMEASQSFAMTAASRDR